LVLFIMKQFLVDVNRFKSDVFGGPDGVRTRDRWIKSPSLYLTKLQAQPWVRPPVFNN
jgi:hypothetical protein